MKESSIYWMAGKGSISVSDYDGRIFMKKNTIMVAKKIKISFTNLEITKCLYI
jgi:hypothetical protein